VGERMADSAQAAAVERGRRNVALSERSGGWGNGLPAFGFVGPDLRGPFPGHTCRRLASGVRELDGDGHARPSAHARENALEGALRSIRPESDIAGGDA